ncbi:MAG: TipAS antibiotic-recognition domain-containing protein [Oscillospiraceae bacterium]|nr:TipAS antibiotic-recognition domain-containing protein [Oscillospiraceae bacterium]
METMHFDSEKEREYSTQARTLYGETEAYKEFEAKSGARTVQQERTLGEQVMAFFVRLGQLRPCAPDCPAALDWVKELQCFFTEHYYNCTPQILRGLAEGYAAGGSMTENIDHAAGAGTGAFAKEVILAYLDNQ